MIYTEREVQERKNSSLTSSRSSQNLHLKTVTSFRSFWMWELLEKNWNYWTKIMNHHWRLVLSLVFGLRCKWILLCVSLKSLNRLVHVGLHFYMHIIEERRLAYIYQDLLEMLYLPASRTTSEANCYPKSFI